jgi:hypothetical protein
MHLNQADKPGCGQALVELWPASDSSRVAQNPDFTVTVYLVGVGPLRLSLSIKFFHHFVVSLAVGMRTAHPRSLDT